MWLFGRFPPSGSKHKPSLNRFAISNQLEFQGPAGHRHLSYCGGEAPRGKFFQRFIPTKEKGDPEESPGVILPDVGV
jgi:hypothetical protein